MVGWHFGILVQMRLRGWLRLRGLRGVKEVCLEMTGLSLMLQRVRFVIRRLAPLPLATRVPGRFHPLLLHIPGGQ